MTPAKSSARVVGALTAGLLALGMLAACTPPPEPEPTKTALFASDEEAFEAAEETYRAYTDAVNAADLSEPESIEPVYDWLEDPAEAASRKNYSTYYAENVSRSGVTRFDTFTPISFDDGIVTVRLCADASDVDLLDAGGKSVVPEEREARQPLEIEMTEGQTPTGLVIRSNVIARDFPC
ncbi:hypothetical protein ACFWHT_14630 [Microbacterium sp. NPDC058342]|uniref:hypothetical protein n=1 Tax=Microbacterium sp. NPDC058342 TaxID=3346454 RepID=UPI003656341F